MINYDIVFIIIEILLLYVCGRYLVDKKDAVN